MLSRPSAIRTSGSLRTSDKVFPLPFRTRIFSVKLRRPCLQTKSNSGHTPGLVEFHGYMREAKLKSTTPAAKASLSKGS